MISQAQVQQFHEQGYVILENVFPHDEIDALLSHIDPFVAANELELARVGKKGISRAKEISFTAHLAEKDPAIRAFIAQAKLVNLAIQILGPDVSLYWDQAVYKWPEAKRDFPWHQDNGYQLIIPELYLTCWLALVDVTIESGCVWIIPGSHRQGVVEHKDTEIGKQCYFGDDPGTPVVLSQGSMGIFSSLLFHRSGPNLSDGIRKGYIIQYSPSHAKHGVTGQPLARIPVAEGSRLLFSTEDFRRYLAQL